MNPLRTLTPGIAPDRAEGRTGDGQRSDRLSSLLAQPSSLRPAPLALDRTFIEPDANLDARLPEGMNHVGFAELAARLHERLVEESDPAALQGASAAETEARARPLLNEIMEEERVPLTGRDRERLIRGVLDELTGYGPIQPLLDDETVTEVMVNGPRQVYVERAGRLTEVECAFRDDAHVLRVIERIVAPLGRRIDEASPMVDARLPDGSRVNAIVPPLAIKGPTLTIRKFAKKPFGPEELIQFGTLTREMAEFLQACVHARLNVLVTGGTGSGKTTTLNVLSSFIPETERIVTIEDAAELQLQQRHVVTLESRPANLEGKGEIPIRMLVKNSLRMRPDRIIIGECRSGEALDMLQAMNTGHDGSLSTLHANSPRDALSRLETLVLMAGTELPSRAIREQIASALDLIVHQSRLKDGSRRITHITEVQGMEGDVTILQDIFTFRQEGIDASGKVIGRHGPTGLRAKCMEHLAAQGVIV
jgi:pilus assembly protein CpaF